jgi:hypothetical protein
VVRRANTTPRTTADDRYMVKREVFGCEGKGRRLGFLERKQRNSIFRERNQFLHQFDFYFIILIELFVNGLIKKYIQFLFL